MLELSIIKHLNKLKQKKFRKEEKEFVVEGIKGVMDALNSEMEVILVIVDGKLRDEKEFEKIILKAEKKNVQVAFCGRNDIDKIKNTETFPGCLAVIDQLEILADQLDDGPIICLDAIKDPGNLGTIIRTADWFGFKNILLSEDTVDVYNPKTVRSTMGSIFHLKIAKTSNLLKTLEKLKKESEYKIYSLDLKGESHKKMKYEEKVVYIFGSESQGIREGLEKIVDKSYNIAGQGQAESLNVAISAAIVMANLSS
ncbi:MAG: RNA methyltransferase [Patescibacteria group bacterium]|nr:RNA methyltransferase [Patescibacteria group bacterium]